MKDRVGLVTGSATGLGRMTARELARRGVHIVVNYAHSEDAARGLVEELIRDYGVHALAVQGDVGNHEDSERMVYAVTETFGRIDYLINNAGPFIFQRKSVADYELEAWHRMLDGNVSSVFYLCRHALPLMRKARFGRIINVGFERAETAPAWVGYGPYAAAKVGLVSLTKTLAQEEASHGITVNMLCPGDIVPPWKEARISEARLWPESNAPVGRMGTGEDIGRMVAFLCEDDSDFITGAVIPVSGGKDVLSERTP